MFKLRKKHPVLTEQYCRILNDIRCTLEVLTGFPVHIKNIDFNTHKGTVVIGDSKRTIVYAYHCVDKIMKLDYGPYWHLSAMLERRAGTHGPTIEVRWERSDLQYDQQEQCFWSGTSWADREARPLSSWGYVHDSESA